MQTVFSFNKCVKCKCLAAFLVRYRSHVNFYVLCKVREPAMGCFSCCCVADDDDIGRRKKHDDAYVPIPAQGCHFSLSLLFITSCIMVATINLSISIKKLIVWYNQGTDFHKTWMALPDRTMQRGWCSVCLPTIYYVRRKFFGIRNATTCLTLAYPAFCLS